MSHVAATSIARHFHRHRGRALSIVALGFALAEGTLPAVAVALISVLGWRATYAAIGAVVLLVAGPLLVWLIARRTDFARPAGAVSGRSPRALDGLRIVVRTRFFWFALPVLLYMPFTSTALIFHIQPIAAGKGWTSELIAAGFTGYAVGHATGLLVSGGLVDRFGGRIMLTMMNLPLFVGIGALGWSSQPLALLLFLCLMGMSSGFAQTTVSAVWAEVYGTAQLGTIRSFGVMLMVAGTALGPAVIGVLLDSAIPVPAICAYLVAAGIAAACLAGAVARRQPAS